MDKLTVVGIKHASGNYNGVDYDNYNIHCLKESNPDNKDESGQLCEVLKVKSSLLQDLPVIGSLISPYYDRNGRVVEIITL